MATGLEPRTAAAKYDAFVDKQVAQVQTRLRRLDIFRSSLLFLATLLGYALGMALVDVFLGGEESFILTIVRGVSFLAFLGLGGFFLLQTFLSFIRSINPRYAARELEKTVPQARNSLINYLDLKDEKLSPVIHGALGLKAARDLKKSKPDQTAETTSLRVLLAVCGALGIGLIVLFFLRSNQFPSFLERAFAPFLNIGLGTRNQITLVQPEKGNLVLPMGSGTEIRAKITGPLPVPGKSGAPALLIRNLKDEPYASLPLTEDTRERGMWSVALPAGKVRGGLFYKVAAGDAETEEYRISERLEPKVTEVAVTYHSSKLPPSGLETFDEKNLSALRIRAVPDTDVQLVVQTNNRLANASLLFESGDAENVYPGQVLDDPMAFEVKWAPRQAGKFRLQFTTQDGEKHTTAAAFPVIEDRKPHVVLTDPKTEITLPPNGTLTLKGFAEDHEDGIRRMGLGIRVLEGAAKPSLIGKLYREGKEFARPDGSYPRKLDYFDVLALDEIRTAKGDLFPLQPGMALEVWVEAWDGVIYPHPEGNRGKSERRRIRVSEPEPDAKKVKADRAKAADTLKSFEKKQDGEFPGKDKGGPEGGGPGKEKSGPGSEGKGGSSDAKGLAKAAEDLARKAEDSRKESSAGDGKGSEKPSPDGKGGESAKGGAEAKNKDSKEGPENGEGAKGGEGADKEGAAQPRDGGKKDSVKKGPPGIEEKGPGEGDDTGSAKGEGPTKGEAKKSEGLTKGEKGAEPGVKGTDKGPENAMAEAPKEGPKGGEAGAARDGGKKKEEGPGRERSLEDVAQKEKELKDPKKAEAAAHELSAIAETARDDKVREAAIEALEADGREVGQPGKVKTADGPKMGPDLTGNPKAGVDEGMKPVSGADTRDVEPKEPGGTAKGADPGTKEDESKTMGTAKAGYYGEGAEARMEFFKAAKALEEYAKNGGDLTLREFSEMLKEMMDKGLLPTEMKGPVEDLSGKVAKLLREEKNPPAKKADVAKAGGSTLPGFSPKGIGSGPGSFDPAAPRHEAPPEFRGSHERFLKLRERPETSPRAP